LGERLYKLVGVGGGRGTVRSEGTDKDGG